MNLYKKITISAYIIAITLSCSASLAAPYIGMQLGRAKTGSEWNVAGNINLGYQLIKYLAVETMYGEYAPQNHLLMAKAKAILPLSGLITGVDMNLFANLGGGYVHQNGQNSIAATYGAGAETMFSSKVGLSFSWQHINESLKIGSYNFFGFGVSLAFP